MRKALLVSCLCFGLFFNLAWADCPEAPLDNGVCDTLYVELFDSANGLGTSGFPRKIYFPLFVSNDLSSAVDSIAGFTIPLSISHTNPAVYCSVSNYWNQTPMGWWFPGFSGRSIYRHLYMNPADPYDTTVNRMADMEGDWSSRGWDMTFLELCSDNCGEVPPHFWLTIVPTGSADQRWWEGSKTLLATMTLEVYDSMTIYIDSTFWPPASSLTFARSDGELYFPRTPDLPLRVFVGTDTSYVVTVSNQNPVVSDIPDQTIDEGQSFVPINLDNYVEDPDDSDDQMIWTYWGNTALQVQIANRIVSITVSNPEWNGSETIWFKACDPDGLCDSNEAIFTITAVNDTPVVSDIPDQAILEGENFAPISLDDYVTDPDNPDNQMIWTYSGNNQLEVQINNRIATVTTPSATWTGSEIIWFKACDPGGLCDSNEGTFTVTASGFAIDVIPETLRVAAGDSGNYKTILTTVNGFSLTCTLTVSGCPGGSTARFDPPVLIPTDSSILTIVIPETLTVSPCEAYPNVPIPPCTLNTYTLTVTASKIEKSEKVSHSKEVILITTLPEYPIGFDVEAFPDTQIIDQGSTAIYNVFTLPRATFSGLCSLSVEGLPSGAVADFDINPVPTAEDTSILTVNTSATTPEGEYDLAIIAVYHLKLKDTTHVKLIINDFTGIGDEPNQVNPPDEYALYQNYPNPFNASTTIKFFLKENVEVKVIVYNILGQKVRTMIQDRSMNRGTHEIIWDGKTDNGHEVPSGIYFYRVQAGSFDQVKKTTLIK